MAAQLLTMLGTYNGDAGADGKLTYNLFAAPLLAAPYLTSAQHPQRDIDFARYYPLELTPGVDAFADGYSVAVGSTTGALRSVIVTLLQYGESFVEKTLPLLAQYEFLASSRLASVERTVDAGLLRARACIAAGDIGGATLALARLLRGEGLPHVGGARVADAEEGAEEAEGSRKAITDDAGGVGVGEALPLYANHLRPQHPRNRAALSWVAGERALPQAVASAVGPEAGARLVLVRAELLLSVGGSCYGDEAAPASEEWGIHTETLPEVVDDGADAEGDTAWGEEAVCAAALTAAQERVTALETSLRERYSPAASTQGEGEEAEADAEAAQADGAPVPGLLEGTSTLAPDALALVVGCGWLLARVEAARGEARASASRLAATMQLFATRELPKPAPATEGEGEREGEGEGYAAAEVETALANVTAPPVYEEPLWESERRLAFPLQLQWWFTARSVLASQLLAAGSVAAAVRQVEAALQEARACGDSVSGRRLLVQRAEVAVSVETCCLVAALVAWS